MRCLKVDGHVNAELAIALIQVTQVLYVGFVHLASV